VPTEKPEDIGYRVGRAPYRWHNEEAIDMLDLGVGEIAVIVLVALVVFGPNKLPQLGKSVGESIREFKKSMKEVTGDEPTDKEPDKKP
jgi:sec-independent protein translocase protein TatA